ncbi:MAG: hypothetical protein JXA57_03545 [Armatimonadetes bacterium]|nr:hypothetical protein [Armatimonadota bacterium]
MPEGKYRLVSFDRQMGIGIGGSMQVTLRAVAKQNTPEVPYCIPNELICAEIGRFLGLPIPPSGVVHAPKAPVTDWFACLDFNLTEDSLPPIDPASCVAHLPDLSAGVVLFDALIANCDRNPGNLSVDNLTRPTRLSIFDHGHALFGYRAGQGCERLQALRDELAISGGPITGPNRHCLLDHLASEAHFMKWLDRVRQLPDFFIEEIVNSAAGLGMTDAEATGACDFLKHRRTNLRAIINAHRDEFRGINQWELLP